MRSLRRTNTLLTVIAVLLGLHLWTWWAVGGNGAMPSSANAETTAPSGILNASAQRKEMVDLLKLQNQKLDRLLVLFESGKARVKVDELRTADDKK